MIEKLYSIDEISEILALSKQTIVRLVKKGEIPAAKIGHVWRFKESDINKVIEAGRVAPEQKQD